MVPPSPQSDSYLVPCETLHGYLQPAFSETHTSGRPRSCPTPLFLAFDLGLVLRHHDFNQNRLRASILILFLFDHGGEWDGKSYDQRYPICRSINRERQRRYDNQSCV